MIAMTYPCVPIPVYEQFQAEPPGIPPHYHRPLPSRYIRLLKIREDDDTANVWCNLVVVQVIFSAGE